jgi:hypothetical protein
MVFFCRRRTTGGLQYVRMRLEQAPQLLQAVQQQQLERFSKAEWWVPIVCGIGGISFIFHI